MRTITADWFIAKFRYEKVMEDGLAKKVTEQYVIDAISFAEAEQRIIEEMSHYVSGEYDIVEIDRAVFKEVFFMGDAEKVLENDAAMLSKAVRKKDKEAAKKWEDETLEEKMTKTDSYWYKSKVQFLSFDENSGKEKRSNVYYLVEGVTLENARCNIDKVLEGTMNDYVISSVSETQILDVFEHKSV